MAKSSRKGWFICDLSGKKVYKGRDKHKSHLELTRLLAVWESGT